jgi:hypothetical protein
LFFTPLVLVVSHTGEIAVECVAFSLPLSAFRGPIPSITVSTRWAHLELVRAGDNRFASLYRTVPRRKPICCFFMGIRRFLKGTGRARGGSRLVRGGGWEPDRYLFWTAVQARSWKRQGVGKLRARVVLWPTHRRSRKRSAINRGIPVLLKTNSEHDCAQRIKAYRSTAPVTGWVSMAKSTTRNADVGFSNGGRALPPLVR